MEEFECSRILSRVHAENDEEAALLRQIKPSKRLLFVPKGAQHDHYPTNQAVAKLGTVPGAQ